MESMLLSAKQTASAVVFLLRAPGTRMAMEPSPNATPSNINLKPTHAYARAPPLSFACGATLLAVEAAELRDGSFLLLHLPRR